MKSLDRSSWPPLGQSSTRVPTAHAGIDHPAWIFRTHASKQLTKGTFPKIGETRKLVASPCRIVHLIRFTSVVG